MDRKKYNISVPRVGMNKSTDYRNLSETEYTNAVNINLESVDGDFIDASFEKSNILSVDFPTGYKVIGRVNRLSKNFTYYFLHNVDTKSNIFGYVDNNVEYKDEEDRETYNGSILNPPLEQENQRPYNRFLTLIDDSCLESEKGFNFHIDFPILNIVLKEEKSGAEIYFTDFRNPSRYIQLDKIEEYFTEEIPCDDDVQVMCPNIDKMRIHTLYHLPEIKDISLSIGGSLSKGSYSFIIALTDSQGNEISEYSSLTQPVDVFENNEGENTNKAIRLKIESLDTNFSHYKIVAFYRQHLDAVSTPYEVGVFSTATTEVVVSSIGNLQRTSIERLSFHNQRVEKSQGLTTANNSLLEYGIVFEKEINLQPVVNLLGSHLEWQTHITTEDIYSKGDLRSKYLGINRNEVVPYSIRFLIEGGTVTPNYVLVGREATASDKEVIPLSNRDRASIEGSLDCEVNSRVYKWQYYNTARVTMTEEGTSEVEVIYDDIQTCVIPEVNSLDGRTFEFSFEDNFYDLDTYIRDNIGTCSGVLSQMGICQALDQTYTDECDVEMGEGCDSKEKVASEPFISEIVNEVVEAVTDTNPASYQPQATTTIFNPYITPYKKYSFGMYERENNGFNITNKYQSYVLTNNISPMFVAPEIPHECTNSEVVITDYYETPFELAGGVFRNKLSILAKWFEIPTSLNKVITINKEVRSDSSDPNFPTDETFVFDKRRRLSFFKDSSDTAMASFIYSADNGTSFTIFRENGLVKYRTSAGTFTIGSVASNEKIRFTIDNPITSIDAENCILQPSWGGYNIETKDLTESGSKVTYDSIKIGLKVTYKVKCRRQEISLGNCEVQPYQRGEFAYWESEIKYPDNQDLYDSTKLKVNPERIPQQYKTEFESKFTNGTSNGLYIIKDSFNLACKPIRHYKFPDNKVSTFMSSSPLVPFNESVIYPLGVTINEEIVNMFLDIAVDSELISQKTRDNIYGYEIFRGDLNVSRSVIASGLVYDLRSYEENYKQVHYSNYPYNSYGNDLLNQVPNKSGFGTQGDLFTFQSPETDYSTNLGLPSELSLQGFQFGNSAGHFDEVEDHPKWTILSREAYNTASTLATIEVTAEALIETAKAAAAVPGVWIVGGLGSTGTNAGGFIAQMILAGLVGVSMALEAVLYKYGRYRHQWQETFKNLGKGHNFANYYFSKGHYNYLLPIQTQGNSVRSLQSIKNIKDGRYEISNRVSKESVIVNNIDREWTVFMDIGKDHKITYPSQYSSYDTNSLTFLGNEGRNDSGRSAEIIKNIASPYVQLYNYNPTLHGEVNSIVWVTTSYRGDLKNPTVKIKPIFGGDTFISRHSLKRKMPLFLTTAMGQSITTPFEYKFYNNIGENPRFYINFDITSDFSKNSKFFPQVISETVVDNRAENKFYIVRPSKFYLFYYGIPSFLTETRINTNFRESGRTPQENFYPNVGDIGKWTQENTVSIREPNTFKYSRTYSNQVQSFNSKVLSSAYTQEQQNIVENTTNGVIISLPDVNENSTINPWLRFRALDFYEFETKFGKLTELKGIENEAILARFEDTAIIYNKVETTVDDGNRTNAFLGGNQIFQRRTASFVNSELGFGGSKHKESLSCEFGHFYVDNERGQVIQIPNGGGNMSEISNINSGGKSTNMKDWFKRNLPLRLIDSNILGIDSLNQDNPYNRIGTTFGYDSLHKRILITKKDYEPISDCQIYYSVEDGFYTDGCVPPTTTCPKGYTLDTSRNKCVVETIVPLCPPGYTYNNDFNQCVPTGDPQPIEFNGADVVFIINDVIPGEEFTNIKNGILTAMSMNTFEEEFNDNIRYSLIIQNVLRKERSKYKILTGFGSTRQQFMTALSNLQRVYPTDPNQQETELALNPWCYNSADLAIEASLDSIGERGFDNQIVLNNGIGTFREGNIARIVFNIGSNIKTGMGLELLGNGIDNGFEGGTAPYCDYNYWGVQSGAEFTNYLKDKALSKGVEIISITTYPSPFGPGSYPPPTPQNNYAYNGEWFNRNVITSDCNYYWSSKGSYVSDNIRQAVNELKLPNCRENIDINCGCLIQDQYCVCSDEVDPIEEVNKIKIDLDNKEFFKEVSWTVAYNPQFGVFSSFFDYLPNYYVNHQSFYSSGRNDLKSLWSHNKTNKSFGVFYGNKFAMEVELLTKATDGAYLGTVSLFTEAKRYWNNQDFYINRDLTFNRSIIYNKRHCSGELNLDLITGGVRFLSRYPITVSEMEQRIPITKTENRFNYSYFYDRVIREKNLPFIKNDDNQIKIEVNNVSFNQPLQGKQLPRIFGDFFLNRLYYDTDSRFAMTIKLQKSLTNLHMSE